MNNSKSPAEKRGTPITYYGGKQRMVPHILPLIPYHEIYVEPFFGGGAVFFTKKPSKVEYINDLNNEVTNFYEQCKYNFPNLRKLIIGTDCYSRVSHRKSGIIYLNPECFSPVERAWAFWMQSNFSFTSRILGGWAYEYKGTGCIHRFWKKQDSFDFFIRNRLRNVYIENKDALDLIRRADNENAFFYVDPPYPESDQGHYKGYSMDDFLSLLDILSSIKGKFLLSSYPYPNLSKAVKKYKWHQKEISQQLSAVAGKIRSGRIKTECLTWNYAAE